MAVLLTWTKNHSWTNLWNELTERITSKYSKPFNFALRSYVTWHCVSFLDIVLLLLFHLAIGHVPKMCMVQEGYSLMVPPDCIMYNSHACFVMWACHGCHRSPGFLKDFFFSPLLPFYAVPPPFSHKQLWFCVPLRFTFLLYLSSPNPLTL